MFPIVINHASKVLPHWLLTGTSYHFGLHCKILRLNDTVRFYRVDSRVWTNGFGGAPPYHWYIGSKSRYLDPAPTVSPHDLPVHHDSSPKSERSKYDCNGVGDVNGLVPRTRRTKEG